MNAKHFSDALGEMNMKYILEAEEYQITKKTEGIAMNKRITAGAAAAVILLSGCLVMANHAAVADSVKGFFRNITRWDGAVTGTAYVEATDEIEIHASEPSLESGKVQLPVEIVFRNPNEAPFLYINELSLGEYKLLDELGNTLMKTEQKNSDNAIYSIADGIVQAELSFSGEQFTPSCTYTLVIESLYGYKKADAPLEIKGDWKCSFVIS